MATAAALTPPPSDPIVFARLEGVPNAELRHEEPLFAADAGFAREFGGPLTRRFLAALPAGWQSAPLVIDSCLVGLARHFDPGPCHFHREPFPEQSGGAWDLANGEREVEHIHAVFGLVLPEFLAGPVDERELPAPQPQAPRKTWLRARDPALRVRLDAGRPRLLKPAGGELVRYGAGAFLRWATAPESAFHFWIRATRGSRRPLVNGIRTHASM